MPISRSFGLTFAAFALVACGSNGGVVTVDAGTGGMDGGRVDGSAPMCTTTGPEDTAAACSDGCDNEPDGFADCNDFGCCSLRPDCGADTACGMRMPPRDAGPPAPACDGAVGPEDTVAACTDGCSNDGDGFADCEEFDCCDVVTCGPSTFCGRTGMRDGGMRCDGGGATENTPALCANGMDDDCDGFSDCDDFGCCSRVACGPGTACGDRDGGMPRDGGTVPMCMMRGPENTLGACTDACDNDVNGFFDCGDRNCCLIRTAGGMPCAAGTFCADRFMAGTVNLCPGDDVTMPPGTETSMAACNNSCDDDRDGFEDCQDRDCCAVRTDCPASTFCGML